MYLLTFDFPKGDSLKTLLTTMESKWKPRIKLPFCYSHGIHLHHLPRAEILDFIQENLRCCHFVVYVQVGGLGSLCHKSIVPISTAL